jgi:hypothetical protein
MLRIEGVRVLSRGVFFLIGSTLIWAAAVFVRRRNRRRAFRPHADPCGRAECDDLSIAAALVERIPNRT